MNINGVGLSLFASHNSLFPRQPGIKACALFRVCPLSAFKHSMWVGLILWVLDRLMRGPLGTRSHQHLPIRKDCQAIYELLLTYKSNLRSVRRAHFSWENPRLFSNKWCQWLLIGLSDTRNQRNEKACQQECEKRQMVVTGKNSFRSRSWQR